MSESVIIAICGMVGVLATALLSHIIARKETKNKERHDCNQEMLELITKYKERCDELEAKVDSLETKVDELCRENAQLRSILAKHGIEILSTEGD